MSKLVQLKRVTDGARGWSHQPLEAMELLGRSTETHGQFFVFLQKMAILMPFWSNKSFEILKPIEQIPPFTSGQVQNTFKILHFGVKFFD